MGRYEHHSLPYVRPPEMDGRSTCHPVIVVGAGPVGLALVIDLALHGVRCVLIDDNDTVSVGSRAICWSKRTLEIFDRLGIAGRMMAKGVTWQVGRLFHGKSEVYAFDLLPEAGHRFPAFVNLQQYYVEEFLIDRARDLGDLIELRFGHRLIGLASRTDGVVAEIETRDGRYQLESDWLVACDGVRSTVRDLLGLELTGQAFDERFLIADVEMTAGFPSERWFWFEPPFHAGQSALLHKQPDDIYRIDLQLGPDADPDVERSPGKVIPRIRAMVGERPFTLDWVSVYAFQCRRLERFVHGRVVFAGDSAHIVSPFGARGGNGGIQDTDNLGWKLAAVLAGTAPESLVATYDEERGRGADENILHSSRATSFMTPRSPMEQMLRDEVLALARTAPFARRLVNSGRLSEPCTLAGLSLQTPGDPAMADGLASGSPCLDAPVLDHRGRESWLLEHLGGDFTVLSFGRPAPIPESLARNVRRLVVHAATPSPGTDRSNVTDPAGLVTARYAGRPGMVYLIRPDQHVAACFVDPAPDDIASALHRALGRIPAPGGDPQP
jgi:3-(3-hydroxy-phenyl)propionate hydroxylase